jgi:hypothetical protein
LAVLYNAVELKKIVPGWVWYFTVVISATWKVEIGRIAVQGQSRQMVLLTLSQQQATHGIVHACNPYYLLRVV